MNRRFLIIMIFFVSIGCAQTADDKAVGSQLPNSLRGLLIEEMQAIATSMDVIFRAIIAGEHDQVAQQAQAIHDSFIMAQKMTDEDSEILEKTLSAAFIERDEAFHHLSEHLAEAARKKDLSLQIKLYQEMESACIACHQNHALDRFPNLKSISVNH